MLAPRLAWRLAPKNIFESTNYLYGDVHDLFDKHTETVNASMGVKPLKNCFFMLSLTIKFD